MLPCPASRFPERPRRGGATLAALRLCAMGLALGVVLGCGSPPDDDSEMSTSTGTDTGTGTGTDDAPTTVEDVRGDRYCEILIGDLNGAEVHVEVYNTYGLNECPQDQWDAVDAAAIKTQE